MSRSKQQLRNQPISRRVFSLPQPADGIIGRSGRCQRRNRTDDLAEDEDRWLAGPKLE